MMTRKFIHIILCLLPFIGTAQENGQWLSVGADAKFSKSFGLEFEQGFRFSDIFGVTQSTYTDIGAEYKVSKELRFGANYRFTQRGGMVNSIGFDNRFSMEGRYRIKFGDLRVSGRLRYLSRFRDYNSSADGHIPQRFIRFKLDLDYSLPEGFNITAGSECFWQLTAYYGKGFNNIWLYGGVGLELSKNDEIQVLYIHQSRDFASDDVAFGEVISISYVHHFDFSGNK